VTRFKMMKMLFGDDNVGKRMKKKERKIQCLFSIQKNIKMEYNTRLMVRLRRRKEEEKVKIYSPPFQPPTLLVSFSII
jgi:hypothetical protein